MPHPGKATLDGVSRETRERLEIFVGLLTKWQRSTNLVSPATLSEVWTRHIADCAQLADLDDGETWLDLGAGAGLPGLIVAAMEPTRRVVLVESDGRKCAFLRIAGAEMGVSTIVHHGRIETVLPKLDVTPDVVTARALASLDKLIGYAAPLLERGARGLFPKGQAHLAELTAARESWQFEADLLPSMTDSQARIIRIRDFGGRRQGAPHGLNDDSPPYSVTQPMPRVLALANQKGGVGKTTTAINLGTALAAIGERVLIIDLDPQGNASTGLGIDRKHRPVSSYQVLTGESTLQLSLLQTAVPNLLLTPSTLDLLGLELEIAQERDRAHRLRKAIKIQASEATAGEAFTYILIDCPPSLNLLTVNALAASQAVLVPLQCEFFALEGLSQVLRTVEQVRTTLNPGLSIQGVVLTMFDPRNNLANQVAADVRQFMGAKVYDTVIPRNVRVSEAPSYGKPVLLYDLKCTGSQAYLRLASEVIQRERALRAA